PHSGLFVTLGRSPKPPELPRPMDKNKVIESAAKLITKGQFEKAVKEYQRVLEVDPDDVRVLQKLAELYQKMNRKAEAADCFEKVARTYSAQGFYLKAVALYKQVLKVIDRVEVNVRLAELYQQLGLVGDATKEWQTVAAYHEKVGDTKASLDTLRKLVDLDPDNVAARIRLASSTRGRTSWWRRWPSCGGPRSTCSATAATTTTCAWP